LGPHVLHDLLCSPDLPAKFSAPTEKGTIFQGKISLATSQVVEEGIHKGLSLTNYNQKTVIFSAE
jgi:hypothetical protein